MQTNNLKASLPLYLSLSLILSSLSITFASTNGAAHSFTSQKADEMALSQALEMKTTPMDLEKGLAYSKTEACKQEFEAAVADGKRAIDEALKTAKHGQAFAVVSDIDETVLDNRQYLEDKAKKVTTGQSDVDWGKFENWAIEARAKPLEPTVRLLAYARSKKVAVFFVTGRMEKLRKPTIENLLRADIAYEGLYLRPDGDKRHASEYKTQVRKSIEDMGFTIALNIGDQCSDLSGGHAMDCEKLPNRMYYIP